MTPVETSSSSPSTSQPHHSHSSVQRSVQSLMTRFFHEAHRCESMIEAENDYLRRQLSYVSDIAERQHTYNSDSGDRHALSLIRAALANEVTDRDLEVFGKRYTTRNKLQHDLECAMQAITRDFAMITTSMETRANSQLQELIDVSSAIECELEECVTRLEVQLIRERNRNCKLEAGIKALSSSHEAYQLSVQREIERLEQLLRREQAKKHECELDFDTFRVRYEAQQWSAYQGTAELGCVEAELSATREKLVFLEIENDQLSQHIRALNASIKYLSSPAKRQEPRTHSPEFGNFEQLWQPDDRTNETCSRVKILSARDFVECAVEDEDRPECVVCIDDVCASPVCSYLDVEFPAEFVIPTSYFSATNQLHVAIESGDPASNDSIKTDEWRFPAVVVCIDGVCTEVTTSYATELVHQVGSTVETEKRVSAE